MWLRLCKTRTWERYSEDDMMALWVLLPLETAPW